MLTRILGCMAVVALSVSASFCSRDAVVYSRFYTFSDSGWMRNEYLDFDMKTADSTMMQSATGTPCIGVLTIRHAEDYPYQDLWLKLESGEKNGIFTTDTLRCCLSSDRHNWTGRGARGVYEWRDTIFRMENMSQNKRFIISRLMDDAALPGIMNVGLTIVQLPE